MKGCRMKERWMRSVFMLLSLMTFLQAEEPLPDDLQIRLGGYIVAEQSTDIAFKGDGGLSAGINIQDLFNMQQSTQVLRLDGFYRFTPKHSIEWSWYRIRNSGTVRNSIDFPWEGGDINASAGLESFFDTDIYKVNYLYSFYHSDEVELGIGAGLHVTRLDVGFRGDYVSDGTNQSGKEDAKVTAPLPVVGFRLKYNITPALQVNYAVDYFFITFDGSTGSLADSILTIDYRLFKNFGLGAGINVTKLRLNTDVTDTVEIHIQHDISAGLLYGSLNF